MNTITIYHIALVTHVVGFTMMAGTTLVDYVIFKQFRKQFAINRQKGLSILEAISKLPVLFGIGFILLIISGVTMMAITHGLFGEQTWFRIKFGIIIAIAINGLAVGRRQGLKLRRITNQDEPGKTDEVKLLKVKNNIRMFHISQLAFFFIIFILSVFKFN